jgi:cupin 2 domain-containing protein
MTNLFSNIPTNIPAEIFTTLVRTKSLKLERIVSQGQMTPKGKWLKSKRAEWVILLKGSATLLFKDGSRLVKMKPGDYINIPAHCAHRVECTHPKQKTIWLALHYCLP